MASCTYDHKGQGALRRRKDHFKREKRKAGASKAKAKMTTKEDRTKKTKHQTKFHIRHGFGRQKTAATQDVMTTRDSDEVVGDVIAELCREGKELSGDALNPEPLPSVDSHAVESARRLGLNKVAEDIVASWSLKQWEKNPNPTEWFAAVGFYVF